uniref:Cytochrome P450 n=2 Tax=Stomoxys calcitrans TaxID=35570 RepID=A0A1I8PZN1_STOCA
MTPVFNIIDAKDAELALNDTRLLSKSFVYSFLHPFLKTGLLTSSGKKWHNRRRLLTPTFHFNILLQFMEVFKRESMAFVELLNGRLQTVSDCKATISLSELIPRFTLNNICETALGVHLDDLSDGDEYRKQISQVEEFFIERIKNPLMSFDFIYHHFGPGKHYVKSMKKLHAFSEGIIEKRRKVLGDLLQFQEFNKIEEDEKNIYRKQRYAMLDSLLRAEREGLIDHAGICEEVDTFMFEAFDTTSMNLIFVLMCLANYADMQKKCYQEIQEHVGDDLSKLDMQQLASLKYLEYFLKETQRLYPSVPAISRQCSEDIVFDEKILLPKGTFVSIYIRDIHRNPKYYEEPEIFKPERFFPQQVEHRHPFAFIPFSAGQRNCIGQKFAMLEMKTLLVYVLKKFILEPITKPESLRFSSGLLLRTSTNVQIQLKARNE